MEKDLGKERESVYDASEIVVPLNENVFGMDSTPGANLLYNVGITWQASRRQRV